MYTVYQIKDNAVIEEAMFNSYEEANDYYIVLEMYHMDKRSGVLCRLVDGNGKQFRPFQG